MKRIMVLGLGNLLMGDDGIGVYLVNDLSKSPPDPDVEYVAGETDVYFCLEKSRQADFLLIVDAVMTGREPGEITVFPCKQDGRFEKGISMHNLHFLKEAMQMQLPWEGIVIGVEGASIGFHLGLSTPLQEKYPDILKKVEEMISLFHDFSPGNVTLLDSSLDFGQ